MAQQLFLVRHGETEWSLSGQHTGRTDIPLTAEGRRRAEKIGQVLKARDFVAWCSPLQRARETCRLAGFDCRVDEDLREWDYGAYEGMTTQQIREQSPEWSIWRSPVPNGESLEHVALRAARIIERATAIGQDVCLFSHGHFLRVLAAGWIGLHPNTGRYLALDTASIGILGYERATRVIRQWNFVP